jgi:hypothetical protein
VNQLKNKLPKGKYNGQTIDGIEVKFQITLLNWKWFYFTTLYGNLIIQFACFKFWVDWHYVVVMSVPIQDSATSK